MDDSLIDIPNPSQVLMQLALQRLRCGNLTWTARRHLLCDVLQRVLIGGKRVGLYIVVKLQPVLEISQELVCRRQPRVFRRGEQILAPQSEQGEPGPAMTDPGFPA